MSIDPWQFLSDNRAGEFPRLRAGYPLYPGVCGPVHQAEPKVCSDPYLPSETTTLPPTALECKCLEYKGECQ